MSLEVALLGRFRHLRYFRFGWERTLVNRMPNECKIGIEVNPKVSWESRLFVPPAGIR
jgi:hypothetical protein